MPVVVEAIVSSCKIFRSAGNPLTRTAKEHAFRPCCPLCAWCRHRTILLNIVSRDSLHSFSDRLPRVVQSLGCLFGPPFVHLWADADNARRWSPFQSGKDGRPGSLTKRGKPIGDVFPKEVGKVLLDEVVDPSATDLQAFSRALSQAACAGDMIDPGSAQKKTNTASPRSLFDECLEVAGLVLYPVRDIGRLCRNVRLSIRVSN